KTQGGCPLVPAATHVDTLFKINRTIAFRVECRIAGGDALHGDRRIVVTIGASAIGRAGLLFPQGLAVEYPQRRGVDRVVVLHGLAVAAEVGVPRATLLERNFCAAGWCGQRCHRSSNRASGERVKTW